MSCDSQPKSLIVSAGQQHQHCVVALAVAVAVAIAVVAVNKCVMLVRLVQLDLHLLRKL